MKTSERLLARLREAGIDIPSGARCVRQRAPAHARNEGAWSWRVDGPNNMPLDIGGWETMTDLVRAGTWDIFTDEFGQTTVGTLEEDRIDDMYRRDAKHRAHTFTSGERGRR